MQDSDGGYGRLHVDDVENDAPDGVDYGALGGEDCGGHGLGGEDCDGHGLGGEDYGGRGLDGEGSDG